MAAIAESTSFLMKAICKGGGGVGGGGVRKGKRSPSFPPPPAHLNEEQLDEVAASTVEEWPLHLRCEGLRGGGVGLLSFSVVVTRPHA